jgi:phage head maturation protease
MDQFNKQFKMDGQIQGNTLIGAAAVTGNLDRGNDVIFPGAFKGVLGGLLEDGFVPIGHDWWSLPVAMPTAAKEVRNQLAVEAEFHSTDRAQEAKTVVAERLAKGLSVGLSIGFSVDRDGWAWFETGKALLDDAKNRGFDLELFDTKTIGNATGGMRGIWKMADLYEFSIVTVPMNPQARATALKMLNDFSKGGLLTGLTFEEHSESVLTAVKEYVARARDYASTRKDKGRSLNGERRSEFEALRDELDELLRMRSKSSELKELQRQALLIESAGISLPVAGGHS